MKPLCALILALCFAATAGNAQPTTHRAFHAEQIVLDNDSTSLFYYTIKTPTGMNNNDTFAMPLPPPGNPMSGFVYRGSNNGDLLMWDSDGVMYPDGAWIARSPASFGFVLGTGSAGQVTYWSGTGHIYGNNTFFWDTTNNRLGIGTNTPAADNGSIMGITVSANDATANGDAHQITIQSATNNTRELELGFNTGSNHGTIQAYNQGSGALVLDLEPAGGLVSIGSNVNLNHNNLNNVAQLTNGGLGITIGSGVGNITIPKLSSVGVVHTNASGVLSTGTVALDGGTPDVSGILTLANGGTGFNGTTATNGQLLIGKTGTGLALGNILATANQTTVTNGSGSITIGTVQNIGATSTPTFGGLNVNGVLNMNHNQLNNVTSINNGGSGLQIGGISDQITISNLAQGVVHSSAAGVLSNAPVNLVGGATEITGVLATTNGGTGVNGGSAANGRLLIGNGTGYSLNPLTAGTAIGITNGTGTITINNTGVLSVGASGPLASSGGQNPSISLTGVVPPANGGTGFDGTTATNGQILVGKTGTGLVLGNILATTNQTTVTNGSGSITIGTVQNINTTSSPTFAGLSLTGDINLNHNNLANVAQLTNGGFGITIGSGVGNITIPKLSSIGVVHTNASGVLSTGTVALDGGAPDVSGILALANGGTGFNGTTATNGQILVGKTGTGLTLVTAGGDATVSNTGVVTLANTLVTATNYGDATHVAAFTVDSKGRLTAANNVLITGTAPGGAASGDLSGTYPSPSVIKINGAALGITTPASGNLLVGSGTQWVTQTISGDATLSGTGSFALANTSTARTNLGLGTMATQNANGVAITGGAIDGTTVGATVPSTVKTSGLILADGTSPITLNASVGTSGQVLTSAGPGATPTWTTITPGSVNTALDYSWTGQHTFAPSGNNRTSVIIQASPSLTSNDVLDIQSNGGGTEYLAVDNNGELVLNGATSHSDVKLAIKDGHLQSQQSTLITTSVNVNATSVSFTGCTDIAGHVEMTSASAGAGSVTLTFLHPYAVAPIVILNPADKFTAGHRGQLSQIYPTSTTTTLTINFGDSQNGDTYKLNYFIIETQ